MPTYLPLRTIGDGVGSIWVDIETGNLVRLATDGGSGAPTFAEIGGAASGGAVGTEVLAAETEAEALAALGITEEATQVTIQIEAFAAATAVSTGDSAAVFVIPARLNGANLISVATYSPTAGTTGTQDVQIRRVRSGSGADVLSTKVTQDSTEKSSRTAATAAVINTSNDDVATDDEYHIDVDAVQSTPANGLIVTLVFEIPLA